MRILNLSHSLKELLMSKKNTGSNEIENLLVKLIEIVGETFPENALLKGGMSLRLMGCPRYTNDLDYVFIPFDSKREVAETILSKLKSFNDFSIESTVNSKCIQIQVKQKSLFVQMEVSVAEKCAAEIQSTGILSAKYGRTGKVIKVMATSTGMANKLAAWVERRLLRDIYDLFYYNTILQVTPDAFTLKTRLEKISYAKNIKGAKSMTFPQLAALLREESAKISDKDVRQLSDYLPQTELAGLPLKLRAAMGEIAMKILDM